MVAMMRACRAIGLSEPRTAMFLDSVRRRYRAPRPRGAKRAANSARLPKPTARGNGGLIRARGLKNAPS
jgi:hypothetical protein